MQMMCTTMTATESASQTGHQDAAEHGYQPENRQGHPENELGDKQGQAVLGVPLDFRIVLLQQQGHQRENPEIGEDDHDPPVAIRFSGRW